MDREPNAQPPENRPDRPLVESRPPISNPAMSPIAPTPASGSYAPPADGQVDRGQYPLNTSAPGEWPQPEDQGKTSNLGERPSQNSYPQKAAIVSTDPGHTSEAVPPVAREDQSFEREPDVGTGTTKPAPAIDKEPKGGQQYFEKPLPDHQPPKG